MISIDLSEVKSQFEDICDQGSGNYLEEFIFYMLKNIEKQLRSRHIHFDINSIQGFISKKI
jgi:hypothetical protein